MDSMKKDLSTNELAAMHSQFNTAKKHNPDMKAEYEVMGKKEKGKAALGWYLSKVSGGRFQTSTVTVASQQRAIKTEEWLSEKEAQDRFGKDLDPHVESGRVIYRESPGTKGVWEYQDTQKVRVEKELTKGKAWQQGQEGTPDEEDQGNFDAFFDSFLQNQANSGTFLDTGDVGFWKSQGKGGEGTGVVLGHSKGKGGGKGGAGGKLKGGEPLPLLDMSEEDKVVECQGKAKKMLSIIQQTMTSNEEVIAQAKNSKYYTKVMDQEIHAQDAELAKLLKICKCIVLGQKLKGSDHIKKVLVDAANAVKVANVVVKDIKGIMAKGRDGASVATAKGKAK